MMTDMNCTCGPDRLGAEHTITCPVYEPPLTYEEIRQLRNILARS